MHNGSRTRYQVHIIRYCLQFVICYILLYCLSYRKDLRDPRTCHALAGPVLCSSGPCPTTVVCIAPDHVAPFLENWLLLLYLLRVLLISSPQYPCCCILLRGVISAPADNQCCVHHAAAAVVQQLRQAQLCAEVTRERPIPIPPRLQLVTVLVSALNTTPWKLELLHVYQVHQ